MDICDAPKFQILLKCHFPSRVWCATLCTFLLESQNKKKNQITKLEAVFLRIKKKNGDRIIIISEKDYTVVSARQIAGVRLSD